MRAVASRVTSASVEVAGERVAAIGPGLLVLLGVAQGDDEAVADRTADKLRNLRIFGDRMAEPVGGREVLCVSQFTLLGDVRRGNRPSFTAAAPPDLAEALYDAGLRPARRGARRLRRGHGGRLGQRRARHDRARAALSRPTVRRAPA